MQYMSVDPYFILKKLSEYSSLSVRTLRNYLGRSINALPHYRIDGKILIRRSEFDAWIEQYQRGYQAQDFELDVLVKEVLSGLK